MFKNPQVNIANFQFFKLNFSTFWFNFLQRKEDGTLADFYLGFSLGEATGDNIAKNEAERRPTREHFGAFWGPFGLILESF